jgi:hypothetical protein
MKDLIEELLPKFLARISLVYVGDFPLTPNRMGYGRNKLPEPTFITSASNSTLSGRVVTPVTRYSDLVPVNPYKRKISFQSEGSEEGSSSSSPPVSDKEAKKNKKQKLNSKKTPKQAKLDKVDHSLDDISAEAQQVLCCNIYIAI